MKLAAYSVDGRRGVGVVREDAVVSIDAPSIEHLLREGEAGMAAARAAMNSDAPGAPLSRVKLHAPVTRPSKFLAIAANYQSHIDEVLANNPAYIPPVYQRWFTKLASCINGPYDPILLPPEGRELDYEAELAIVIGKTCRRVSEADAPGVVAGYTVCNDVSVRDWQRRSPTIVLGKSFDTHGPLGPWIVTPDEVGDPHALRITCTVNGQLRQNGSTSEMINSCWAQIAYLSTVCTLEPGDVIATGTPFGTGAAMKPSGLLRPGDVVRCEVEKIGAIEAVVQAESVA